MPLINITLQHQLDQKSRDLIVQQVAAILASQHASLLQKVLAMSETVAEAVANLNAATQDLGAKAQAGVAAFAATIADLQAQLAAAQAGDPGVITAIDAATAAVGQVSATLTPPAPEGDPEPEPTVDPNQPQG